MIRLSWERWALLAAAAWVVAQLALYRRALIERGRAEERLAAQTQARKAERRLADSTAATLHAQLAAALGRVAHDTVRVPIAIDHYRTIRDTVRQHLTDTLLVKAALDSADRAADACTELRHNCAEVARHADSTDRAFRRLTIKYDSVLTAPPIVIAKSCALPSLVSAGIGAGLDELLHRLHK